jgi:hypothetical protein
VAEEGKLTSEDLENDFLGCIPWDGREAELPRGASLPRGISADYFAKTWDVKNAVDLEIDEERVAKVMNVFGKRAIELHLPESNKAVDRWQWKEAKGTDGLLLYIISVWNREKYGRGVVAGGKTINRPQPKF